MAKRRDQTSIREVINSAADVSPPPETETPKPRQPGSVGFLAPDPPFTCLGANGDRSVILDNLNQIQEKLPRELNRNGLVQLCGRRPEWLFENYPERNKDGEIIVSDTLPSRVVGLD